MTALTGVAKRVHDRILAADTDEEARLYATMIVSEALQADMANHQELIQDTINKVLTRRVEVAKGLILRSTVTKRLAGEEIDHLLAAAQTISKAAGDDPFTRDERGRFSSVERRTTINYARKPKKLPKRYAQAMGVPDVGGIDGDDKARYQQAYAQIGSLVAPYAGMPDSVLEVRVKPKNGPSQVKFYDIAGDANDPIIPAEDFKNGAKVIEATVRTNPGLSARGASFDLVGTLAGSQAGIAASRAYARVPAGQEGAGDFAGAQRLGGKGGFVDDWNKEVFDNDNPRAGLFQRMAAGSRLLVDAAGDQASERTKLALGVGEFVGRYGAEAEKVIGPAADRTAYRYRGVERKPDEKLLRAMGIDWTGKPGGAGVDAPRTKTEARNRMIYGPPGETVVGRRDPKIVDDTNFSETVKYFQSRLPDPDRVNLQAASGVMPPSEGIIIDRNGKVVTQAVGYGEDWYLPFNLKNLGKLKGGEYIRTRAWGGPTTEDIYTGLMSGARAVTVVSHNGVYTVEFDPAFRGSRRYSDKAGRMVKRYGHLLDATKSKQVTMAGIPEARMEEIEREASRHHHPREERDKWEAKRKELIAVERRDPQMAAEDRQQLAREFLTEATEGRDGTRKDFDEIVNEIVEAEVKASQLRYGEESDDGMVRASTRANLEDNPAAVIARLGLTGQWNQTLKRATAEYKAAQSPLNLDGVGYHQSMQALREQFPYYIARAEWQPNKFGREDIGYVKPRHTRPAGVLAGYYDPTITGHSKVSADATRWQAGRKPAQGKKEMFTANERPKDEGSSPAAGGGSPSAPGGGTAAAASPLATRMREEKGVRDLWRHLNAKGAEPMTKGKAAGKVHTPGELPSAFPVVFGNDESGFMEAYRKDPTATKRKLLEEVRQMKQAWDIDDGLVDVARDPEVQVKGRKWDLLTAIGNRNATYDLGEEYRPGRQPEAYRSKAETLLEQLPVQAKLDDTDLDAKLDAFISEQADRLERASTVGAGYVDESRIESNVKKAIGIKQLLRRHQQAIEAQAARQKAMAENEAGQRDINITVSPQQARRLLSDDVEAWSNEEWERRNRGQTGSRS